MTIQKQSCRASEDQLTPLNDSILQARWQTDQHLLNALANSAWQDLVQRQRNCLETHPILYQNKNLAFHYFWFQRERCNWTVYKCPKRFFFRHVQEKSPLQILQVSWEGLVNHIQALLTIQPPQLQRLGSSPRSSVNTEGTPKPKINSHSAEELLSTFSTYVWGTY